MYLFQTTVGMQFQCLLVLDKNYSQILKSVNSLKAR